jgi:hypothetical protein
MSSGLLEAEILDEHGRHDSWRLAALYLDGAEERLGLGEEAAAAFFFTQAYVFALDGGDEETAATAHACLVRLGRDS